MRFTDDEGKVACHWPVWRSEGLENLLQIIDKERLSNSQLKLHVCGIPATRLHSYRVHKALIEFDKEETA